MSAFYNFLRIPTAIMGLFLIMGAVSVDLDLTGKEDFVYYLPRLAMLAAGLFILIPNHYFLSPFKYKLRLFLSILTSIFLIYSSIRIVVKFIGNNMSLVIFFAAVFIIYIGLAFPMTVYFRNKYPEI